MSNKKVIILVLIILFIGGCSSQKVKECSSDDIVSSDFNLQISNTGSMLPTLDDTNKLYFRYINSIENIKVNDIILFKTSFIWNNYTGASDRVHRIVKIGYDNEGWYAITKGDNIKENDGGVRRFEDIKGVLICKK